MKTHNTKSNCYSHYLHEGAGNGSTPELVQQGFTHSHIRNASHSICDYNYTWNTQVQLLILSSTHHVWWSHLMCFYTLKEPFLPAVINCSHTLGSEWCVNSVCCSPHLYNSSHWDYKNIQKTLCGAQKEAETAGFSAHPVLYIVWPTLFEASLGLYTFACPNHVKTGVTAVHSRNWSMTKSQEEEHKDATLSKSGAGSLTLENTHTQCRCSEKVRLSGW